MGKPTAKEHVNSTCRSNRLQINSFQLLYFTSFQLTYWYETSYRTNFEPDICLELTAKDFVQTKKRR